MVHPALFKARSVAIIGASENTTKPGGRLTSNILNGGFDGELWLVNPKGGIIRGRQVLRSVMDLPTVELAFLAIPAEHCITEAEVLMRDKNTRTIIIVSAGFGEAGEEGRRLEAELVRLVGKYQTTLVGPNCIGLVYSGLAGIFTLPLPPVDSDGCIFISGSGATAVFILESAIDKGLTFSHLITTGNGASNGIEEFLAYFDLQEKPLRPRPIMLYIETIRDPDKFLKHTASLRQKGYPITAIKAGTSEAGSRAAASHTGAMVSGDAAVEALFRKAGIVRCYGRDELATVAMVMATRRPAGKRVAIVTHAGGPAVMLTDALSAEGFEVPRFPDEVQNTFKQLLHHGAATANPVDLLATGTPQQLDAIVALCDDMPNIDLIMVIFGSTGLDSVSSAYKALHCRMQQCHKPVFPVLPSVLSARSEVDFFVSKGHFNFPDEVQLARALGKVIHTPEVQFSEPNPGLVDLVTIRNVVSKAKDGYLPAKDVLRLFGATQIPVVKTSMTDRLSTALLAWHTMRKPVVLKLSSQGHKTEQQGVSLNIRTRRHLIAEFKRLKAIDPGKPLIMQEMANGTELFLGARYEPLFGHVVVVGLGGTWVEYLHDTASGLAPLTYTEARGMLTSLSSYPILAGARGKKGVDIDALAQLIVRFSTMLRYAVEIKEVDINPLIASPEGIWVVDSRVVVG